MSSGDSGIATVGPTGALKGVMVTGLRVEDQEGGVSLTGASLPSSSSLLGWCCGAEA